MIRATLPNGARYLYKPYREPGSVSRQRNIIRLSTTAYKAWLAGKVTREKRRWHGKLVRPTLLGLVK